MLLELAENFLNASLDSIALAVSEEELTELCTAESAENELAVKVLEDVADVGVGNLLDFVKDLLVSLLGNCSLTGITETPLGDKEFLEYILKVEFTAPTPTLCEGHGDSVTVVYLGELVSIGGVNNVTAKNAGEGVTSEHCTLAGSASGDNEIACAGVKKNCGEDTDLNVGKLLLVLCGIHTVVEYLVTEGLYHLLKSVADKGVFSRLAVFVYKCDFHFQIPFDIKN